MLQKYGELVLWLVRNIPSALGDFVPLFIGGAALLLVSVMAQKIFRGKL